MKRKVARAKRDAATAAPPLSPVKRALGGTDAIRASHALHGAVRNALAILEPIHGRDMARTLVSEILSSDPPEEIAAPSLTPPVDEQTLNVQVEFTGGAAAALRTVAAIRGMSVERVVTTAMAGDAAMWLADSSITESPEYASIFGLDPEGDE